MVAFKQLMQAQPNMKSFVKPQIGTKNVKKRVLTFCNTNNYYYLCIE